MLSQFLVLSLVCFTVSERALQAQVIQPQVVPGVRNPDLVHDCNLWTEPKGARMGIVKPAAVFNKALQWLPLDGSHPPKGWHRVQVTGWMVARGKEGAGHLIHDHDEWWHVAPQGKGGISATNVLNLHARATMDKEGTIASLTEGAVVHGQHITADTTDGREWVYGSLVGWINPDEPLVLEDEGHNAGGFANGMQPTGPPIPLEATLTFPHPDHAATVSHRIFWIRGLGGPINMAFTNHRADTGLEKGGMAQLNGAWTGHTFTSKSQTIISGYQNWVNETLVIRLADDLAGGTVTSEYPRKNTTVSASAELHRSTGKAVHSGKGS